MMMFNTNWFKKNQEILLLALNAPFIGDRFREILKIDGDKSSVGYSEIVGILPNSIFWKGDQNQVFGEFRTHNKFAKRIHYGFLPVWKLLHKWDMAIANNFMPGLNLGFDTLTVFPDPDPESSTVDGQADRSGVDEALGTIRGGAGVAANDTNVTDAITRLVCSGTVNQYARLLRSIFLFNTVNLGDGSTIDSATFSLFGDSKSNAQSGESSANSTQELVASTPASNTALVAADFAQLGSTSFGSSVTQANWSNVAYNDITINATGLSNISKTGVTKFGIRSKWDLDNTVTGLTWGIDAAQGISGIFADTTGTSTDPKLAVVYTPAGGGVPFFGI